MATTAVGTDFYKLVAVSGVPEALGLASVKFRTVTFWGCKAAKVLNNNTVYVRFTGSTGWMIIAPGNFHTVTAVDSRPLTAAMFEVDITDGGDGVLAITQNPPNCYDGPA